VNGGWKQDKDFLTHEPDEEREAEENTN